MLSIQKNTILAPYTTYKLGGPADYFISVKSSYELEQALLFAYEHKLPYFVLGTGANILISDAGFRGLVIKNDSKDFRIEHWENDTIFWLRAESGALISDIVEITSAQGYSGFEHFAGIPSTVGGALWQNLHFLSPDRDRTIFIEEIFHHAYTFNTVTMQRNYFDKDQFKFGYDTSILHKRNQILTEAVFKLIPKDPSSIQEIVNKNLAWRRERHPWYVKHYSCGSVFKKIEEIGAGRLIDECGLKGYTHKGVTISEKHANFFIHHGEGTATAVKELIEYVQKLVHEKTGYLLETEIGFIGF